MKTIKKRDQEYIRQKNLKMVLDIIKSSRPISRADIVKLTDMSPTSVSRIVGSLIDLGLIKETETTSNGVGRKAILLDLEQESVMTVGVYIDKHVIIAGIVNFGGEVLHSNRIIINSKEIQPEVLIDKVCGLINIVISDFGITAEKLLGIGVSLPGLVNSKNGEVVFSASLSWKNVNIGRVIEDTLGIRTIVDNDVKLKALAENMYGVAKDSGNTALINFGSGVGSALIIDGDIYRGIKNIAGEIGHITIDPNGILCDCGRRGCLQTFIVEDNLIEEGNRVKKVECIGDICQYANNGESWASSIIEKAVTYMCVTINNIVCMYNPDTIVLSGSLIEENPSILRAVEERSKTFIWEPIRGSFKLVHSKLKSKADIIGPSTLALNTFLSLEN